MDMNFSATIVLEASTRPAIEHLLREVMTALDVIDGSEEGTDDDPAWDIRPGEIEARQLEAAGR